MRTTPLSLTHAFPRFKQCLVLRRCMLVGVGKIVHFPLAILPFSARKGKLLCCGNQFIGLFSKCATNRLMVFWMQSY
jgi:hypothetical protein